MSDMEVMQLIAECGEGVLDLDLLMDMEYEERIPPLEVNKYGDEYIEVSAW